MKMPFGKHKGKEIDALPDDYLIWLVTNTTGMRPPLRAAVHVVLNRRGYKIGEPPKIDPEPPPRGFPGGGFSGRWWEVPGGSPPPPPPPPPRVDSGSDLERAIAAAVSKVRRAMAAKHHPDRGGDGKLLAAVNDALDAVIKEAKR